MRDSELDSIKAMLKALLFHLAALIAFSIVIYPVIILALGAPVVAAAIGFAFTVGIVCGIAVLAGFINFFMLKKSPRNHNTALIPASKVLSPPKVRLSPQASCSQAHKLIKVLLLGEVGVGKSHFLARYLDEQEPEDIFATTTVDFETIQINKASLKLQIWDNGGFTTMPNRWNKSIFKNTDVCMIFVDLTNNFKTCKTQINAYINKINSYTWQSMFAGTGQNTKKPPLILLIGTKKDLITKRQLKESEGVKLAEQMGASAYLETSAFNGDGIKECFQKVMELISLENSASHRPAESQLVDTADSRYANQFSRQLECDNDWAPAVSSLKSR